MTYFKGTPVCYKCQVESTCWTVDFSSFPQGVCLKAQATLFSTWIFDCPSFNKWDMDNLIAVEKLDCDDARVGGTWPNAVNPNVIDGHGAAINTTENNGTFAVSGFVTRVVD